MKKCPHCAEDIQDKAKICKHCGKNVKSFWSQDVTSGGCGGCLMVGIVGLIIVIAIGGIDSDFTTSSTGRATGAAPRATSGVIRYAHRNINVRSGRGTSFEVVAQISRGQSVRVDSLVDGWYRVSGATGRYVSASVLESQPLPDFEIVDWNWRKDRGFGTEGAIIYQGQVRNNTAFPIRRVQVTITIYDADGNFLDTDFTYTDGGMAPGALATFKSYAEYWPTATRASVRVVR